MNAPASRLRLVPTVLLAAFLALVLGLPVSAGGGHDHPELTILHHGKIFTADPDHPWAQAVAIAGDEVLAVGGNNQILRLAHHHHDARLYDLGGRTVIPGLNDAHVHSFAVFGVLANAPTFIPGPGPTLSEVLDLVAAAAAIVPEGTLISALVGTAITDDPLANRFAIDAVAPNHPVKLETWWGHGLILNTRALEEYDIPLDAADPFGGFYERLPSGEISGVLHEYAEHRLRRTIAERTSDAEIETGYQAIAARAVQLGVTSMQDMSIGLHQERSRRIAAAADLPLRWRAMCVPLHLNEPCPGSSGSDDPARRVRAGGIKWLSDGTPLERLAFVFDPYADLPSSHGRFNFTDAQLAAEVARGRHGSRFENQLLFHAVGDAAIDKVFDALQAAGPNPVWRHRRPRIEHGDMMTPADVGRAADLGVVVVQNPTHLALADVWAARSGPVTFARLEPLQTLLAQGVHLALGSDAIGFNVNPFLDLFLATIHPTHPSEALTLEQAVTAYTAGSAYAEHAEHRKGRLAPGQLADLAVLSQDIFTAPPPAIPGTVSVLTLVGGDVVWDAGLITASSAP